MSIEEDLQILLGVSAVGTGALDHHDRSQSPYAERMHSGMAGVRASL